MPLSPQFVNAKELRVQMGALNGVGILEEKLKTVGVKKEAMVDSFLKAVEGIPEGSEDEKKLPDAVVQYYNSIVEGSDPSPEEIAKMEKGKRKGPKREGPSNEQLAYDMVTAGKSEDDIAKAFAARYTKLDQKDAGFVKKRIAIYIRIAKKRIEKESGGGEEATTKSETTE
jgi:hypothetical protein